ncbi:hypothetical protein BH23DEI1_BH23DEI1_10950 [soil metagenome]
MGGPGAAPRRIPHERDALLAVRRMDAVQLKRALKRYQPTSRASRKADMVTAIANALETPSSLDALIRRLTPLESLLLSEAKRHGGKVDGWRLVMLASLHGHRPAVPERWSSNAYGCYLSRSVGAAILGELLIDGVLLPGGANASWFESYGGHTGGASDVVRLDPRLLERLPDLPPPPLRALRLEREDVTPAPEQHPAALVIELLDVLHLIVEEGGLPLTRSGTVGKPFVARLLKRRPRLAGRVAVLAITCIEMGLVRVPPVDAPPKAWSVAASAVRALYDAPLHVTYAAFIEAACRVGDPAIAEAWAWGDGVGSRPGAFWLATIDALALLPDHPVAMSAAADALWERALEPAFMRRDRYGVRHTGRLPRPTVLTDLLLDVMPRLGLVATAERRGPTGEGRSGEAVAGGGAAGTRHVREGMSEPDRASHFVLAPALGRDWYLRARTPEGASPARVVETKRSADPTTAGQPTKAPCLLIGPNFEVLAYLDSLSPGALAALACASADRVDAHTATFTLDQVGLNRALDLGFGLDELLDGLRAHGGGIPGNVEGAMRAWAKRRERLRVTIAARLLEFAGAGERDAAIGRLRGARAVGERFALLDPAASPPAGTTTHRYKEAPARSLAFSTGAAVRVEGPIDLAGQAALASVTRRRDGGSLVLDREAIRAGGFTVAVRDALQARAKGGIPPQVDVLLGAWSATEPKPALAAVVVFAHPRASAWALHPEVAAHLAAPLSDTTFLVVPGHEGALAAVLEELEVAFGRHLEIVPGRLPDSVGMQIGLSTRRTRELIEEAVGASAALELRYARERGRTGYGARTKGKILTEVVVPELVTYEGSIPYLVASTDTGQDRLIRIGYIEGIAVRWSAR